MRQFFRKRLSAFLLTVVMVLTMVPAVSARSADITYSVKPGDGVSFDVRDFEKFYNNQCGGEFRYVKFAASTSGYNNFSGYVSCQGEGLSRNALVENKFYGDRSSYGDYPIKSLALEASRSASDDAIEIGFTVYGENSEGRGKSAEGTLRLEVSKSGSSSNAKGSISYTVKAGEETSFNAGDFKKYYDDKCAGNFKYVRFSVSSGNYSDFSGYVACRGEEMSRSELTGSKFYYDDSYYGDYPIQRLTLAAGRTASDDSLEISFTVYGETSDRTEKSADGTLVLKVSKSSSASAKGNVTYTVRPGDEISFSAGDFEKYYDNKCAGDFKYVTFSVSSSSYGNFSGYVACRGEEMSRSELTNRKFYDDDPYYGDYAIKHLTLAAGKSASGDSIEVGFTVYGEKSSGKSDSADGTLVLEVSKNGSTGTAKGDITYAVRAGGEVLFKDSDFEKFYSDSSCTGSFRYVEFSRPDSAFNDAGTIYFRYGKGNEKAFTRAGLSNNKFYYDDGEYGDYDLEDLSFVAEKSFSGSVKLAFTVYGGKSGKTNQSASGTLVITTNASAGTTTGTSTLYVGNIRYSTTSGTPLQINPNDIARFFRKYTGAPLQYLNLRSVPATGSLYYNYYNTGKYGPTQTPLSAATAGNVVFSYSPAAATEYDLSELTYIPSGSNYCTALDFTGYSASGTTVSGTILISVTASSVSEVYSVTTRGTSVTFPAASVYSAVASATGAGLAGIQLLELPAATAGVLYSGAYGADTTTVYSYGDGAASMGQLRFLPNSGFTGSVAIPYVALGGGGTAIGSGVVSIGVVDSVKSFKDVSTATWCYKYVTELSGANIISGYGDGSFQEKNTITYGAALKLIMLAAGYGEQAPTVKGSTFSGYLAKAKAEGLVTGNPKLNRPITRLQIAQIAAKALKLSTSGLPSKKPFTDTNDVHVQALNAAGIIEGYFSNGTSTYKPNNTLTRGQVSAIVWRMKNSRQ